MAENYAQEIAQVEAWWRSPRFAETTRPYSAKDVVGLRSSLMTSYPSNHLAKKLFALLTTLKKQGNYSHTFGALDPIQVIQMAAHVSSIYVSGWQCSSTASTR